MSIPEQVAREHSATWNDFSIRVCRCGAPVDTYPQLAEHITAMTEALTRAQVAAEIRERARASEEAWASSGLAGEMNKYESGLYDAAQVAEGGERE